MSEKISIIVPVYNVEAYLSQCLESIIIQTYTNLEIILVNDGSEDRCPQICDEYAAKDSRIKVIHKENEGLGEARNTGLEAATANYIGHIDSDDVIHPKMYELLMELMLKTDADITYCSAKMIYNDDINIDKFTDPQDIKIFNNIEALEEMMNPLTALATAPWGKLYKKSLFSNIRYPKGDVVEDVFTTWKLLYKISTAACLNVPLYYYRIRQGSVMQTFTLKRLSIVEALKERTDYFHAEGHEHLFRISREEYISSIIFSYCMVKETQLCGKNFLRGGEDRFYAEYKRLNLGTTAFGKSKLKHILFYVNPTIYYYIWKAIRLLHINLL